MKNIALTSAAENTFRPGTKPHKAVEYFAAHPKKRLTRDELANAIGVPPAGLSTALLPAIEAGLLGGEKSGRGYTYFAPEPAEPPAATDGKLDIVTYADGDVGVSGMAITDEGTVFTREQLLQLITHVTTPHVKLPGRAPCAGLHE